MAYNSIMMVEKDKIRELLSRNVVETVEVDSLEKRLRSGEKLRIKLGIDPTGPKLHLGRAIALRKLKEFQDLGHQIVLIVGDFTALVGDASDKESERAKLTKEQIKKNMKGYKDQVGKILDIGKVKFYYNSKWFGKIGFEEIIRLASLFTAHQLINRRNFKERFESGSTIGSQEFFYPWMQGYDSVEVSADVEIGGTDQLFNLKAGRKVQQFYNQKSQDIMTLEMLDGLDGEKMSTSKGNVINIIDDAKDMFGKVMSMKDEMIIRYFWLTTDVPEEHIKEIEEKIKNEKMNPVDAKKELAFEITKIYHGEEEAKKAQDNFTNVFQEGGAPEDMEKTKVPKDSELKDVLVDNSQVSSVSEFRRLLKEGAIDFDGEKVNDVHYKIEKSGVVRIGKKKFIKLEVS